MSRPPIVPRTRSIRRRNHPFPAGVGPTTRVGTASASSGHRGPPHRTISSVTSSFEFPTYPARLSDAERDKALRALRDGVAMGRLSHDTFLHRMELALAARRADELAALTADLPRENGFSRAVLGTVEAVSGFTVRLRRAQALSSHSRLPRDAMHAPPAFGREVPPLAAPGPDRTGSGQRAAPEPRDGLPRPRRTAPPGRPVDPAGPRLHQRHHRQRTPGDRRRRRPRGRPGDLRAGGVPARHELTHRPAGVAENLLSATVLTYPPSRD